MSWLRIKMKNGDIIYINLSRINDIKIFEKHINYKDEFGLAWPIEIKNIEEVEFLSDTKAQPLICIDLMKRIEGKKEKEEGKDEEEEEK